MTWSLPTARASSATRWQRSQSGFTLIELLLSIAVIAIIFVPLMAWTTLALRQQPVTEDGLLRTAQSGLLGSVFPSDVSVAAQAWVSGMSEPWATDCAGGASAGGSIQVVMISGGATVQKVVYVVAKSSKKADQVSIWRRVCGVGSDNSVQRQVELFKGVRPGTTSVSCKSPAGDKPCREIKISTTPLSKDQPITMSATRRIDASAVPIDVLGNPLPVAVISLVSRTPHQPIDAVFSAAKSSVGPERTIATYKWEFEPDVASTDVNAAQVSAKFPVLAAGQDRREFTVRLTVTDDLGSSNTTFFMISSSNLVPVAVISSINPNPATVGSVVTLSALPVGGSPGSYDPDGAITDFQWTLTPPQIDPAVPVQPVLLNGPTVSYATQGSDVGVVEVMLTVTDLQFGQSTASSSFSVINSTDPGATTVPPSTVPPSLVASFVDSPGSGVRERTFDASSSFGALTGATYAWDFGDGTTGSGVTASRDFPTGGQFTVVLTVTNPGGENASTSRMIQIEGSTSAPLNVRHNATSVLWDPVVGARRYLVDFEFRTPTDCLRAISNQAVGPSGSPSKQIPKNPCPRSATTRARVGADSGSSVTWSGWIAVPTINDVSPTTTTPEVVK